MNSEEVLVALVTAPDLDTARTLAREALERHVAACVNLIPSVESHYWWNRTLDSSTEVLMLIKTHRETASELERVIVEKHPYDTPEFILVPLAGGNERYLQWWKDAMFSSSQRRPSTKL